MASASHMQAANSHVMAAKEHHKAGRHDEANKHAEAASAHFTAAKHHGNRAMKGVKFSIDMAFGNGKPPMKGKSIDEDADDDIDSDGDDDPNANQFASDDDQDADGKPDAAEDLESTDPSQSGIAMEELLCDLLQALGVPMPDESNEQEFKKHLYEAVMSKIKELTSEGMGKQKDKNLPDGPDQNKPPSQQPNASQPNPLIKQEPQPMYMSLEEINRLPDPMRGVALAMYQENVKLRNEMNADRKRLDSLNDAKLREENAKRNYRINLISRLSPRVKPDLDAMLANPNMALSMGEGGTVVDPMAHTLAMLEKQVADIPRLLTADASALSVQSQPSDDDMMTDARATEIADGMARMMGVPAPVTN